MSHPHAGRSIIMPKNAMLWLARLRGTGDMRRWFCLMATIATLGFADTRAHADDKDACINSTGETAIAGCTQLILSKQYKGVELAKVYFNRGFELKQKGDTDRAISDYGEAIRINPGYAKAHFNRGMAFSAKGDDESAIADYGKAIKIDPKYVKAYYARGIALSGKGDLDSALVDYSETIKLDGKQLWAYFNRGVIFRKKQEFSRAIADFTQAIRLDSEFAAAYANRGETYLEKSEVDLARADFRTALGLPAKNESGQRAHDTARKQLAALEASQKPALTSSPAVSVVAAPPALAATASVPVSSGRRVALVIGNSTYRAFPKIPNPRKDAEDLAKALSGLGFEVVLGTDLTRADMEERLIRFSRQARGADTALVFYAGHGLQHQGINYLAPVDARLDDESDLRRLVNLQDVIADLQGASRVRILMVDACRDNEAVQQLASSLPKTRAAAFSRGLAKVDADGTLIAFATQANRVAADGDGRNSPFTTALLKYLPMPGVELRTLMTRVRADVVQSTEGRQRPEVWDSLVGEFAFK